MPLLVLFIIISIIFIIRVFFFKSNLNLSKGSGLLERFRMRFKNKNRVREKLMEEFSYSLLNDPEANIMIGSWYSEIELREKADIHRSRLSKYGRSKMNGEMLFLGPKGGVYKLTSEGKKKYL